jgi:pyruvate dehydrogenase (quinone)
VPAYDAYIPARADLERATDILNREALGAPIVKALLGKAAAPDDSPYTTVGLAYWAPSPPKTLLKDATHSS